MEASDIKLSDWQRILFGNISPLFLAEVFLRTTLVYLALLVMVRLLGKRMSGQLTLMEMSVMLTLGAIVSVPMQSADRGILQGLLILLVVLLLYRGLNYLGFYHPGIEKKLQGKPTVLVRNGILQLKDMEEVNISKQQLFSELRSKNIFQLGGIRRVYLEPAGSFSILMHKNVAEGLPIYPPADQAILKTITRSAAGTLVCMNCGKSYLSTYRGQCNFCRQEQFTAAVK